MSQHNVGLLPGDGQELALKDLNNSEGRSPPTLPEVQWTSGRVGGLDFRKSWRTAARCHVFS